MKHVILGGKSNALAIARSLRCVPGDVHVITNTPSKVCKKSKYVHCLFEAHSADEVLVFLFDYDCLEDKVVYPTSDYWVEFLASHSVVLRPRNFLFTMLSCGDVDCVLDKLSLYTRFHHLVRMPRTVLASDIGDSLGEDYIVKPRRSFSGGAVVEKGFRTGGEFGSDFVAQERLCTDIRNHYSISGVAADGNILFGGLTNKVLEFPSPGGTATLVVTSSVDAPFYGEALSLASSVVKALGYNGVFEVEVILHDSQLWFIEINPRFWLQHEIFSAMGVNVARMYFDLCMGNEVRVDVPRSREGLAWIHEGVLASLPPNGKEIFLVIYNILFKKKVFAHWRAGDIRPLVRFLFEILCKRK